MAIESPERTHQVTDDGDPEPRRRISRRVVVLGGVGFVGVAIAGAVAANSREGGDVPQGTVDPADPGGAAPNTDPNSERLRQEFERRLNSPGFADSVMRILGVAPPENLQLAGNAGLWHAAIQSDRGSLTLAVRSRYAYDAGGQITGDDLTAIQADPNNFHEDHWGTRPTYVDSRDGSLHVLTDADDARDPAVAGAHVAITADIGSNPFAGATYDPTPGGNRDQYVRVFYEKLAVQPLVP